VRWRALSLAVTLGALGARAEGQAWSAVGPRTIAVHSSALEVEAGWPGVGVALLRGVSPGVNVGGRVSLLYGVEGLVRTVVPGLKAQGLLKLRFIDTDRLALGLTFEPGPFVLAPPKAPGRVGFALPVSLRLGVAASSAFTVAVLVEVPLWLEFGPAGGVNVPLLSGVGLEYFVTSQLAVFFRGRLGPTLRPSGIAELTFDGGLGLAVVL
jgi:hypothetical protein